MLISWLTKASQIASINFAMDQEIPAPLQVQNIRATYAELGRRVHIALHTQIGDVARLDVQRIECFQMLGYIEVRSPTKLDLKYIVHVRTALRANASS